MALASNFDRVIWVVLDGVGAGELPDASAYGDSGANTLGNLARVFKQKHREIALPHLAELGLGNITPIEGVPAQSTGQGHGAWGRAKELSQGKDTTSGHWEMAGLVVEKAFPTYTDGFSQEVIDRWCRENNLPGVLGNKSASGTEIIAELGDEHIRTGKPILYTSADSVWQVAAHEEAFGLQRLYDICKSARKLCDELQVGRVIARPFIGNPAQGKPYTRTYNRKDYAQLPFAKTILDELTEKGIATLGIGKISNIYAGRGVQENIDTKGNADGIRVLIETIQERQVATGSKKLLVFCNLIDFDMLYGHRRDVPGFAHSLEEFDRALPQILGAMTERDLLILASDHGNDPTFKGTDHTREYIPLLAYTPAQKKTGTVSIGTRESFADVGATVAHALIGTEPESSLAGQSFLAEIL